MKRNHIIKRKRRRKMMVDGKSLSVTTVTKSDTSIYGEKKSIYRATQMAWEKGQVPWEDDSFISFRTHKLCEV